MHFQTLLTKSLPILALPAILLLSMTAEAADLDISSGAITPATSIGTGLWTFSASGSGVVTVAGQNVASTIEFDCEVDSSVETIDCIGELTINGVARSVFMGQEDDTIWWTIRADAPALFKDVHEQWGQAVMPNAFEGFDWEQVGYISEGEWDVYYGSEQWDFSFWPIIQRATTLYFAD